MQDKEKKQDRRIRKTRAQLRRGLAVLMREKSIKEITIKELVDEVDINRSTFYLHYSDIYDLLEKTEQEISDELVSLIDSAQENATLAAEEIIPRLTTVFQFIKDNFELAQAFFGPHGDMNFISNMEKIISEHCIAVMEHHNIDTNSKAFQYKQAFCITGCVGLIKYWTMTGFEETAEQVATECYGLAYSTLSSEVNKKG